MEMMLTKMSEPLNQAWICFKKTASTITNTALMTSHQTTRSTKTTDKPVHNGVRPVVLVGQRQLVLKLWYLNVQLSSVDCRWSELDQGTASFYLRHLCRTTSRLLSPQLIDWLTEKCLTSPPTQYRLSVPTCLLTKCSKFWSCDLLFVRCQQC